MTGFIDPLDFAGDDPAPDDAPVPAASGSDADVLQRVRELALQAHREVVPELVGGASLDELLASIEPARQAYANLATRIAADRAPEMAAAVPLAPPAGGGGPAPLDLDRMPASEKLRRGIAQRVRGAGV